MALGSGRAIEQMASSMGLTAEQAAFIYRLQPGQACIKSIGEDPFLIVIPELPIRKDVADGEVKARMSQVIEGLPVVPRIELEPDFVREQLDRSTIRFLEHIAIEPLLSITERFRSLGLSAWSGERIVKELLRAGMVKEVVINRGGRGGRAKYLELTQKGRETLREEGVEIAIEGRGGIAHLYWQHRICQLFRRRGYYAEVETPLGDMFLDVFASDSEGRRVGVQVIIGELDAYEFQGIRKAVLAGLDEVIVACDSEAVLERLEERLPEVLSDCGWEVVKVVRVQEFASGAVT
jgi:DNA-binding MarR family transcriptional regulator